MSTITIEKPVSIKKTNSKTIRLFLNNILSEYSDFDIELMQKYYQTKDLDESHFVNI